MKTIKARYNCGRWIWDCPDCSAGNKITPGDTMGFCGGCYKDKQAIKEGIVNGVIIRGYDKQKQDLAKREAWANDEVYKISFPTYHKQIVEVLRIRYKEHQSWAVGETIDDLLLENKTHKELKYIKQLEEKEKVKPKKLDSIILPDLDDKTLRRIK